MRRKGKITSWNDDKGFGFIAPVSGGRQVFVHVKAFENRTRRPGINQLVEEKVRQNPAQYLWSYRRFKAQPEGAEPFYDYR